MRRDDETTWTVGTRLRVVVCTKHGQEPEQGGLLDGSEPLEEGAVLFGHDMSGYEVPRIRLDDGRTVYGYECWWWPEAGWED